MAMHFHCGILEIDSNIETGKLFCYNIYSTSLKVQFESGIRITTTSGSQSPGRLEMSVTNGAKSFATLLRQSKFIALGDFRNSTVVGKVFHTTDDYIYVDYGLKFHAVVRKPREDARLYTRGATVKLKLIDYEITDRFIGSDNETSLLESDAVLLGLESTPVGRRGKSVDVDNTETK